jgi:hypothetical protein
MTDYIDTYVSGPDRALLEAFAGRFANHIPSQPGRAAIPADGTTAPPSPAVAASGDPALFYACIRATTDVTPSVVAPMAVVDPATGAAVVGVFA